MTLIKQWFCGFFKGHDWVNVLEHGFLADGKIGPIEGSSQGVRCSRCKLYESFME